MKPKDRLLQGISVAQEIANILITRDDVLAVVLCGSLATQLTDSPEDVDINIFTVHPPPRGIEMKCYVEQKLGLTALKTSPGSHLEIRYREWVIGGFNPWSVKEIEEMLTDILAANAQRTDTGICGAIATSQILCDPNGIVAGWKRRLASYPPELCKRIIEYELPKVICHVNLLRDAVRRSDTPYLLFLRYEIIRRSVKLVLATNGVWDMAPKWMLQQLKRVPRLSSTLVDDLEWIAAANFAIAEENKLREKLRRLVEGLFDLVSVTCTDAQIEKWWFF